MLFFNTSSKQAKEAKRWEIAIPCAENSKGSYVITYIEEKITSTTGILTIKNGNDFDIIVHLFADGKERTQEIKAGGFAILYQLSKEAEYTVGCYADVTEGTEIKLMIFDGTDTSGSEDFGTFAVADNWSIQEIEDLFLKHSKTDWKLLKCVSVFDFAYDCVGAVLYKDQKEGVINIGFIDDEGVMQNCGIEGIPDENLEFLYHGDGEVTFNVCRKGNWRAARSLPTFFTL